MSYLDLPRLHISGRFFCDPSTVNNDPEHYKSEVTRPAPWQMPEGMHYFRFFDCAVKRALNLNGESAKDTGLIGASVQSVDQKVPAKLVDLDVYQQAVTQIFGLSLNLSAGKEGAQGQITAVMRTPVLNGAWFKAVLPTRGWAEDYGSAGSYGADGSALGVFQTVLEVKKSAWKFPKSGLMETLRRSCTTTRVDGEKVYLLSFKFVLDGYWNIPGEELFQTGRMVGTIGPLFEGDPHETLGARWLEPRAPETNPPWYVPYFSRMPFRLDESSKVLQIDWAGGLPRQSFGGDPVDLGEVEALARTSEGLISLGSFVVDARTYAMSSGISELPLKPEQVEQAAQSPVILRTSRDDVGPNQIFAEAPDGLSVSTQSRCIRMTSDQGRETTKGEATAVVRQFGKPLAGKQTNIVVMPLHGNTPGATVPPTNPGDTPQADGALVATVSETDTKGIANVQFEAVADPGSRTSQLDGQMYFVYVFIGDKAPSNPPIQEQQISVLVWSRHEVLKDPGWNVVRDLMIPYAKLYPGMTKKFDLSKEDSFIFYSNNPGAPFFVGPKGKFDIPGHPKRQDGVIPYYLTLPIEDPRYMLVTRDLSPPKIETILNFIANEQAKIKARVAADDAAEAKEGGGDV